MSVDFALRAPWYERERGGFDLRNPRALRPTIQKYGEPNFVDRMLKDPRDSLAYVDEDRWSYPIAITPTTATGRERFATHRLCRTWMRKLFQPIHDRYYAVAVEVFCEQPGLPRAGDHDDLEVGFVMRRHQTTFQAEHKKATRRLARELIVASAKKQGWPQPSTTETDSMELYVAHLAWFRQFVEDHGDLIDAVNATHAVQAWMVNADGGLWRNLGEEPPKDELERREEEFPMWRLPDSAALCEEGKSRSVWFGVVPTFSSEHWIGPKPPDREIKKDGKVVKLIEQPKPVLSKLDDHEIYELLCFVRQPPERGKEDCPPKIRWSKPTRPFRLAAPSDPEGTKNHSVTIAAPDLRRLGAAAAQKVGPGGVRIVTPPGSGIPPVKFGDVGNSTNLQPGAGGTICVFAIELFFIVGLFVFLLFLPIVALMLQLWWMLALKFCVPRDLIQALQTFLETHSLSDVAGDQTSSDNLDAVTGMSGAAVLLSNSSDFVQTTIDDLVDAMDPELAAADPEPPPTTSKPADPLCPQAP
jgi:hypothetical protein